MSFNEQNSQQLMSELVEKVRYLESLIKDSKSDVVKLEIKPNEQYEWDSDVEVVEVQKDNRNSNIPPCRR